MRAEELAERIQNKARTLARTHAQRLFCFFVYFAWFFECLDYQNIIRFCCFRPVGLFARLAVGLSPSSLTVALTLSSFLLPTSFARMLAGLPAGQVQGASERKRFFETLEKQSLDRQAQHFQKKRAEIEAQQVRLRGGWGGGARTYVRVSNDACSSDIL